VKKALKKEKHPNKKKNKPREKVSDWAGGRSISPKTRSFKVGVKSRKREKRR
jgi:hypothetical protein